MLSTKTIMEKLTGPDTVETFERWMAERSEDFAEDRRQYVAAMDTLEKVLGAAVARERAAIVQQCASDLLFCGLLGLKANWDHYTDPMARTFLELDFEVFLQEETAHALPEYTRAQKVRDGFYRALSDAQKEVYEPVTAYTCHLETVAPKLAHYYGYLLGNELLPRVVPGYRADPVLTRRYTEMLNRYFGIPLFDSLLLSMDML